jgi:hypothetical protein
MTTPNKEARLSRSTLIAILEFIDQSRAVLFWHLLIDQETPVDRTTIVPLDGADSEMAAQREAHPPVGLQRCRLHGTTHNSETASALHSEGYYERRY